MSDSPDDSPPPVRGRWSIPRDVSNLRETFLSGGVDPNVLGHREQFGENYRWIDERRKRRLRRQKMHGIIWSGVIIALSAATITAMASPVYSWVLTWAVR